jgi:hypothetical protein
VTDSTDRVVTLVLRTQNGESSNYGIKQSVLCGDLFRFQQAYSRTLTEICPLHFLLYPLQFIIHWSSQTLLSERLVKRDVNN